MSARRTPVLVGARGVGKSTAGARAAELAGLSFVDLDERVLCMALQAGRREASVGELLAAGEAAFRELEAWALRSLLEPQVRCLVATGGGVVERADNRVWLARSAFVVWLEASAETLRGRLATEPGTRPALRGGDPLAEVDSLLAERAPLYAAVADARLSTEGLAVDEVARRIAALLT